jgi:uracil-DNA glycosylase
MRVELDPSWEKVIGKELIQPYFLELLHFLADEYGGETPIYPPWDDVFKAFQLCPFDRVKVVVLGQDPYPTKGHAHGLSFSVQETVHPLPKSLGNIFKELESDLGIPPTKNGNLERWASQGVLLLNTVLTVREGTPGSHENKGWEQFTDAVIQEVNRSKSGVVFVLWGAKAQCKIPSIDTSKHLVIATAHPSPLAAYRGFFGSNVFSEINLHLEKIGRTTIHW